MPVSVHWQDLGALAAFGRAMRTKTFIVGDSQHVANSVYGISLLEPTASELVGCRTAYRSSTFGPKTERQGLYTLRRFCSPMSMQQWQDAPSWN